jgi:hypothetical protein
MRRFVSLCCAVVVIGCGGGTDDTDMAADTSAMAEPPAPAGITLADVAGTWNVQVMPEVGDSVVASYTLVADADSSWNMVFTGRTDTIQVRVVSVAGDSIVTLAGPFKSAVRPGVTVTSEGVMRLQSGMLMGMTTAHYTVTTADSVLRFRSHGTRAN